MKFYVYLTIVALAALSLAIGCSDITSPFTQGGTMSADADEPSNDLVMIPPVLQRAADDFGVLSTADQPAPSPLVTVNMGADQLAFWPYTGTNYSGTPQDPINLIFYGKADPRDIRAALLALDGDRSGTPFPAVPPFTLTWRDCIGDVQTGYADDCGWTGGVIQLSLGDYSSPRFHIRLFQVGDWTVANAHFEVLIPGTADHQVLSWELAEQLVMADIMRTGLLDPDTPIVPVGTINDAPFRTIPAIIYNELPVELRMLIGGPVADVTEDVPIATDGQAAILNLAAAAPRLTDRQELDFVVNYGQVVPKPFCSAGPYDYVYVSGPVTMHQRSRLTPVGDYLFGFVAEGELSVTPVDPMTGNPTGATMTAQIYEYHGGSLFDQRFSNRSITYQVLNPVDEEGGGSIYRQIRIASSGANWYKAVEQCGSETNAVELWPGEPTTPGFLDVAESMALE